MSKAVTTTRAKQDTKTQKCLEFYLERTRINADEALLKKGLHKEINELLAVGELVTFEVDGDLRGVKKAPRTEKQVSQDALRKAGILTKWKDRQKQAEKLQRELDGVMDIINKLEAGCLVPIEVGSSLKTLQNPKVD